MDFIHSAVLNNRGVAGKVFLLALAVFLVIIVVATVIIFPKMNDFFLSKGIAFASEKTIESMPAPEGYNPAIHATDPLIARAAFAAVAHTLELKELVTDSLKQDIVDFMQVFRKCYDDQTIMPEEQTTIITALDTVQMRLLKSNFAGIIPELSKQIEIHAKVNPMTYHDIVGFDSVAIYNDKIKMGMTMPLSVELINIWQTAYIDNVINDSEFAELKNQLDLIDRFQTQNEFDAITRIIFNTKDFIEFPNKEQFRENCRIIISRLRDLSYDYASVKNTLKSFVIMWHEQMTTTDDVKLNLEPLYQFTVFASNHALQN